VWWPSLINITIVSMESTDTFSAANTRHRYYHWFCDHIMAVTWDTWGIINWELRKIGHFVGYGMFCLIFYTCVTRTLLPHGGESLNQLRRRRSLGALVCTFLLAVGDEFHQTFIPSRTGSFHDVITDTVGGFAMLTLWFGLQTFFRNDSQYRSLT
jgi:hypothetical protein